MYHLYLQTIVCCGLVSNDICSTSQQPGSNLTYCKLEKIRWFRFRSLLPIIIPIVGRIWASGWIINLEVALLCKLPMQKNFWRFKIVKSRLKSYCLGNIKYYHLFLYNFIFCNFPSVVASGMTSGIEPCQKVYI